MGQVTKETFKYHGATVRDFLFDIESPTGITTDALDIPLHMEEIYVEFSDWDTN